LQQHHPRAGEHRGRTRRLARQQQPAFSPQATVTGVRSRPAPAKRADTSASNVSSNQGAWASACEDSIASRGLIRSGWARNCRNASLRSAGEAPISSSSASSRRAARTAVISDPRWNRASAGVWKPAGDSAVAKAATPRLASSNAIQPPSEVPATWARPTPSPSMNSLASHTSESIPGGVPGGGIGDAANPGRSKAITSR
jgi:hypothetical protein